MRDGRRMTATGRVIAENHSGWNWEYDNISVDARVILDERSGGLKIEIIETHTKSGLGAGTRNAMHDYSIGDVSRPRLGDVKRILKKHGMDRSRAGYPFSAQWTTPDGRKGGLGAIIAEARVQMYPAQQMSTAPAAVDADLIKRKMMEQIERMSPAELEKLYRVQFASEKRRNAMSNRLVLARELVDLAKVISAAEAEGDVEGDEVIDEAFGARVRTLRSMMNKLVSKKKRMLRQYGIGIIRPNSTVEDLVAAMERVVSAQ